MVINVNVKESNVKKPNDNKEPKVPLKKNRFLRWQGSTARRTAVYTAVNEDSSTELTQPA
jgi:hypothetical protein